VRRLHTRSGCALQRHVVLLVLIMLIATPGLPGDKAVIPSDEKRAARIQELQRERARIERELRALQRNPDGMSRATAPRTELAEQPTRSTKESIESLPGVSAQKEPSGRDGQLSIRGTR
jgi:hypothetical protein